MGGLLSLIWAGLSSSLLPFWSVCPQGRNCSAWGPSISCLRGRIYFVIYFFHFNVCDEINILKLKFRKKLTIKPPEGTSTCKHVGVLCIRKQKGRPGTR